MASRLLDTNGWAEFSRWSHGIYGRDSGEVLPVYAAGSGCCRAFQSRRAGSTGTYCNRQSNSRQLTAPVRCILGGWDTGKEKL